MNHKPIRTYERKTSKTPFLNSLALSTISSKRYNPVENCHFNQSNDSLCYDPFETTFDRVAKGVIIPPKPLNIDQNDSWKGNSSDSDIVSNTSIKSSKHLKHNDVSDSTYISLANKYKQPKKSEQKVMISKGTLRSSKRVKVTSKKDKTQSEKKQSRKRQVNRVRRKKAQEEFRSNTHTCNEMSHINSNTVDNMKDVLYKNDICPNHHEYLHQNNLEISKTSQKNSFTTNEYSAEFKYMANYKQVIKPCFVKLNACTVHNYMLNCKKISQNMHDVLYNVESICTGTLRTKINISKKQNAISQSVSTEYNDFRNFKHTSIKQCYVSLCDNIVKNWYILKNKRNMKDSINIRNESNVLHSVTFHNPSEIALNCNKCIKLPSNYMKENKDLIEDSFKKNHLKVEELKIRKFVKEYDTVSNEKKHNIISSTPLSKHVKPSNCSIIFSPINSNICDNWGQECSLAIVKDDVFNTDQKDSHSFIMSESYKFESVDIQKQQRKVSLSSQKSPISINAADKNKLTSYKDNIHITQKYETKCKIETENPYSLNISIASTDQSRSLFDDTKYNHVHSAKEVGNNIEKEYSTNALGCKKIDMVDSFADACLKQKQLLDANEITDTNLQRTPYVYITRNLNLNNVTHMKQEYKNESQRIYDTEINTTEMISRNFDDEVVNFSKHSLFDKSQNNIVEACVLPTRLQDSIRIGKRIQYPKWHLSMSNISDNLNNESTQSNNEVVCHVATDKVSDIQPTMYNSDHSKNMINSSFDFFESVDGTIQLYNSTNKQMEKSVFLKPGKCWARSLSILNNINNGSNLHKLSIGKGKKWRHSVRDLLDMQKQGISEESYLNKKDDTDIFSNKFNAANISDSNCDKKSNLTNHDRFSKRISMRVVLNNLSIKSDIKDTPFLEAFGIIEKSPNLKQAYRKDSLTYDDQIIKHSATARDVILQRCSQNDYMHFSDCFPDSYLEHCHKIGEGVYGEVFLHEYGGKKSVIKIIPIEGKQLVNGEPQKKFNEILSEIVIAKELDNLRLNATYKTSGFVEVKNISCIIGKYPKKLIELWNVYDNDKASDNDCPSMFDETQLYIALELGHGGEDLEAFVFQTAEETYALFLQIALALAVAEKALEFEHRDMHWGNILVQNTKEPYIYYDMDGKEIKLPSHGVKMSIIDFTLSRMLYQGCCIYNDLALDPALFTAHGEYQFEIYRLMRDKIQNNWQKFEPYTNVLWLHYILDKMITAVRYKKKNLKIHRHAIIKLRKFKDTILNYDSAIDFVINSNNVTYL
ncbi:hypothetical protein P5V15_008416 [Pogonomyrmex californicus]